jgi:hypothetical protein
MQLKPPYPKEETQMFLPFGESKAIKKARKKAKMYKLYIRVIITLWLALATIRWAWARFKRSL